MKCMAPSLTRTLRRLDRANPPAPRLRVPGKDAEIDAQFDSSRCLSRQITRLVLVALFTLTCAIGLGAWVLGASGVAVL